MTLEEIMYQCLQDSSRWFPEKAQDMAFLVLCLNGEAGELANNVKKVVRGTHTGEELDDKIKQEVTDTFIYLMNIVGLLSEGPSGFDLVESYKAIRDANELRFGSIDKVLDRHIALEEKSDDLLLPMPVWPTLPTLREPLNDEPESEYYQQHLDNA